MIQRENQHTMYTSNLFPAEYCSTRLHLKDRPPARHDWRDPMFTSVTVEEDSVPWHSRGQAQTPRGIERLKTDSCHVKDIQETRIKKEQ